MVFARSVVHPLVLNAEAPTGFTDTTLGGNDVVSQCIAITTIPTQCNQDPRTHSYVKT